MRFIDRVDAGRQLLAQLKEYAGLEDGIVVGLPRGGVVTAKEVAKGLKLPLDITCPRKIGAPNNPEFAVGAISESGECYLNASVVEQLGISEQYLNEEIAKERQQAKWRLEIYRQGMPPRDFAGKSVILVDDGLATGSTMRAAIRSIRAEGADKIVVAIPVSPYDTLEEIRHEVDAIYCLTTPSNFYAVGQFYDQFYPTTDEEVLTILGQA